MADTSSGNKRARTDSEEGGPAPEKSIVPDLLIKNALTVLRQLTPPETSSAALLIQSRGRDDIGQSAQYNFSTRPGIITSWNTRSMFNQATTSMIFTRVGTRESVITQRDIVDFEPVKRTDVGNHITFTAIDPNRHVRISARDNSRGYDIESGVSAGTYGVVYFGTATKDGRPVALKFIKVNTDGTDRNITMTVPTTSGSAPDQHQAQVIKPGYVEGMFFHYALQRSYGGCMPLTVCLYDTFLYAKPSSMDPRGGVDWYIVLAMERMDGDLYSLSVHREIQKKDTLGRFTSMIGVCAKMTRAIFDLEVQSIFHNDIKPGNFLYKNVGKTIKVTDFDLGCFASRLRVDNQDVRYPLREYIKYNTDGAVSPKDAPWDSDPNTKNMGLCRLTTTPHYMPPEYSILDEEIGRIMAKKDKITVGDQQYLRDLEINTYVNTKWLSKMMAYQLVRAFREMALDFNLNSPYYNRITKTYTANISNPTVPGVQGEGPPMYNNMDFEGKYAIAPIGQGKSMEARIKAYDRVKMNSVNTEGFKYASKEIQQVVREFNELIANVIAPKEQTVQDPSTVFPLDKKSYLCIKDAADIDRVRPTVTQLLKKFTVWTRACGIAAEDRYEKPAVHVPVNIADEIVVASHMN